MLRLVDLSNNNAAAVDFGALRKSGVFGVWHKVSEGTRFADPLWHTRAAAARSAGLRVGGYHFARPAKGTAAAEAEYFARLLGPIHRRDLRPFLDLEVNDSKLSPTELHTWARTFLEEFHTRTGVRALTYSSSGYILPQHWGETFGTGAGLLLADYGPDDGADHGYRVPVPWRRIVAHQYTSRGKAAGVVGNVDRWHAKRRRPLLAHPIRGLL